MKSKLKNIPVLKYTVIVFRTFKIQPGFLTRLRKLAQYLKDYKTYRSLEINPAYKVSTTDLFPRIHDKTTAHKIDPVYFIQGCWCAKKIFESKPERHFDVASQALMVGIISQFTPTTMVDIRPISISLPGLSFVKGDITKLPFKDNEIESLSSICVIEHIGLGRYGDQLDQFGTEKAANELKRVLATHGSLYISAPIDDQNRTYFNAHRAFTRNQILKLFEGMSIKEEAYIYGQNIERTYDPTKGFGTGLFHFIKL
jgi:SAM-dependent methyltransferase